MPACTSYLAKRWSSTHHNIHATCPALQYTARVRGKTALACTSEPSEVDMAQEQEEQDWLLRYADACKVSKASLKLIWADLNISQASQQGRLDRVHSQALERWPLAVKAAEQERETVQQQVAQAREDIKKLGWELGVASEEDVDCGVRALAAPARNAACAVPLVNIGP